jgi:hypothetical protein
MNFRNVLTYKKLHYVRWIHSEAASAQVYKSLTCTFCACVYVNTYMYMYIYIHTHTHTIPVPYNDYLEHWNIITSTQVHMQRRLLLSTFKVLRVY